MVSKIRALRRKIQDSRKKGKPDESSGASDYVPISYHKGGRVKRTGQANLRKGEQVLTGRQYSRLKRRAGKSR
jgi:hypothetical protein